MQNYKQVGVWIDHSKAHLIGFKSGQAKLLETVDSPYESIKRIEGEGKDMTRFSPNPEHSSNNEHKKHNTTQNEINEYLRMMEQKLQPFEDILLFGPGTMKEKMKNRLREKKAFEGKWLSVEPSDKLTENQLLAFVREFYTNESV
jgi:hypothetical protein